MDGVSILEEALLLSSSGSVENPRLQQIEASTTVHLAFQEHQAIHLSLHSTIGPNEHQTGLHRSQILLQTRHKTN